MTEKVFWADPYLTRLDVRVAAVDADGVTLDRTIFYAQSGGQESDSGTIGGRQVLDARKAGREIVYSLGPDHGLRPGDAVVVEIDWTRRYRLMRLHFAAEIVLELVSARFNPIEKIGAHIAADKARIDFAWPSSLAPAFPEIAAAANALVAADRPIESGFSDTAAEQRFWRIADFAQVPCGGTHLKRTGEIGEISLKRKNIGKGKERIEITAAG